jgi:hypothetical protein
MTKETTMVPQHTARDCDETCHACAQCYLQHGLTGECDKLCEHAADNYDYAEVEPDAAE